MPPRLRGAEVVVRLQLAKAYDVALRDLKGVHRSGANYLMALCPVHEERRASLHIHIATGYAGCFTCQAKMRVSMPASTKRLPYIPKETAKPMTWDEFYQVTSHPAENLSVDIMLQRRKIGPDAADYFCLRAMHEREHDWLVIPYLDELYRLAYAKRRQADGDEKIFDRKPSGATSILFNLPALANLRDDEAPIIVEGELDVVALHQMRIFHAVSVPNGCGSTIDSDLLQPLRRFKLINIGTDTDETGEQLAVNLARALYPRRCQRITWS